MKTRNLEVPINCPACKYLISIKKCDKSSVIRCQKCKTDIGIMKPNGEFLSFEILFIPHQ